MRISTSLLILVFVPTSSVRSKVLVGPGLLKVATNMNSFRPPQITLLLAGLFDPLQAALSRPVQRDERQVNREPSFQWPNATIPYFLTSELSDKVKVSVTKSIEEIQNRTCVRFQKVPSTFEGDVVRITADSSGSCSSLVGRQGGVQDISLGKQCYGVGTATHELMHAIGIEHTQSRSDRNEYLDIMPQNISPEDLPNFELLSNQQWVNLVPYDYGSVMHYTPNAFAQSDGEETMIPKQRDFIETMGSEIPNFYDYSNINIYYHCYDRCSGSPTRCVNGGVVNPNNCRICNCPLGYGGDFCDQRPLGCGATLAAAPTWQRQTLSAKFNRKEDAQGYTMCTYWITAPPGATVYVMYRPSNSRLPSKICDFGCPDGGIEVKHLPDPRITNDRDCCMKKDISLNTTVNPLPILVYTGSDDVSYDVDFRFI